MKILIPSSVMPNQKSLRIQYISEIKKHLNVKTELELFWFVYQLDKINLNDKNILDIHNYQNALDCLNQIMPDYVLVGSYYEPMQYAFSLSCKKLNIPLVSFYYFPYDNVTSQKNFNKIISTSRIITSNSLPTDTNQQKTFLRRFRFILFKLRFLSKTKKSLGQKSSLFLDFFLHFNNLILQKNPKINILPDLHLLPDSSWIIPLTKNRIAKEKLCITGSPFWDTIFHISKNYAPKTKDNTLSILIVTDALVEHGVWSRTQFTIFIRKIVDELSKNSKLSYSFKIHPASENKESYTKLFENSRNIPTIYQHENLWDIIKKFDLVITFGFSTIHSELALVGVKTILLDFDFNFDLSYFVEEAIVNGNVVKCTNINDLSKIILDLRNKSPILDDSFIVTRETSLYKFDGKSGKRCSDAILKLVK